LAWGAFAGAQPLAKKPPTDIIAINVAVPECNVSLTMTNLLDNSR
jgi:hypothetical protein